MRSCASSDACRMLATAWMILALLPACSILASLDGLSGGAPRADAGSPDADAGPLSLEAGADAAGPRFASCGAAQKAGGLDGVYIIDPDGDGPKAAFQAFCDQSTDGGGWMLVTRAMIEKETPKLVTSVLSDDARGGLSVRVYANSQGCSLPDNDYTLTLADRVPWTKLRAQYVFAGATACWEIFGANDAELGHHMLPFESTVDTIRDMVRMGGSRGNAFDGKPQRCDNTVENFWHSNSGIDPRTALVILRRSAAVGPAGFGTRASCTEFGPGTTGPTYWEYKNIYVR